jgi:threonine dehydrogenase-like Zn-dependent dehydrogenase
MRAMVYRGPYKIRVEEKDIPAIEHTNDAIVRVKLAAICGSDLHLYHGMVPDTRVGMTFGHEFIGVVHEVGPSVQSLKPGDRVIVPFNIYCGSCYFCVRGSYSNFTMSIPTRPRSADLRVLTHLRWLRRWAGRVRAGALRRCWAQFASGVDGR